MKDFIARFPALGIIGVLVLSVFIFIFIKIIGPWFTESYMFPASLITTIKQGMTFALIGTPLLFLLILYLLGRSNEEQ